MIDAFIRHGEARSATPLRYDACGLDGIFLCNGYGFEKRDDVEFLIVKDREDLHQAIATHLVTNRKVLAPKEIKFIRTTMNLTQKQLGEQLGATSQSVARWEKGQTEMPGSADRLIRIHFQLSLVSPDELAELVRGLAQSLEDMDEVRNEPVHFNHGETWKEAA